MSTRLRFLVPSAPPVEIPVKPQHRYESFVSLTLRRTGPVTRPVHLARTLKSFGLRLSDAHEALNRIVADEAVTLQLAGTDRAGMVSKLAKLGVRAE